MMYYIYYVGQDYKIALSNTLYWRQISQTTGKIIFLAFILRGDVVTHKTQSTWTECLILYTGNPCVVPGYSTKNGGPSFKSTLDMGVSKSRWRLRRKCKNIAKWTFGRLLLAIYEPAGLYFSPAESFPQLCAQKHFISTFCMQNEPAVSPPTPGSNQKWQFLIKM